MKIKISAIVLITIIFFFGNNLFCQKLKTESAPGTAKYKISKDLFTAFNLMTMHRLSDLQLSPGGKNIIYVKTYPEITENSFSKFIYSSPIEGGIMKKITKSDAYDYNPRWSPGSKKIAFISTRGDNAQAYVMDFPNGEPEKVTDMPNGISNFAFSPDGKYYSFTSEVKLEKSLDEKYPKYPKANIRIYEDLPVRHWDEWTDKKYSHLFIQPVDGGEPKDLMPNEKYDTPLKPWGGAEEICWAPDGKEIAYTSKKADNFVESTNSDIYIVDIEKNKTKNITKDMPGFDKAPLYSPDGDYIAFTSQRRAGFEADKIRLMIYDRETGQITDLTKTLNQWVYEFTWAPDGNSLYFTAGDEGTIQIYNVTTDGKWEKITDGVYRHGGGLSVTPGGKEIIYGRQRFQRPVEFYKMNLESEEIKPVTQINEVEFAQLYPVNVEQKWIESTDGKKVHCWVLYPPNFNPSEKYPMITYCQGGPQSTITPRFHYRWNLYLMASHGYVVVAPNRRGLPGFGQEWNDAISLDWGGQPMEDILAATDEMKKEKYIDEEKLCAVGASAGGYAVFWLAGNHDGRFKAFVSHCGVFDFISMYGSTEELWFPNWEYGGPYWKEKNKEQYVKHSPHTYADKWDTPIMISTGEHDYRVPYTQSLEAFTVAQVKDIPSKLVYFPEETHFIAHPQEFIVWSKEFFEFLDKYTKGE